MVDIQSATAEIRRGKDRQKKRIEETTGQKYNSLAAITRQLKESICIRKEANCMNRDGGAYNIPTSMTVFWSRAHTSPSSRDHMPDEVRRWRTKRRN